MLQFDQIQNRVRLTRRKIIVRPTQRKKYELCILVILIYIVILGISMYHYFFGFPKISYKVEPPVTPIDSTIEDFRIKETQDFLINTPGCYIPNYAKTFKYSSVKQNPNINDMCGVRYIFIDTLGDDKIKFRMHKYTRGGVTCCYQFVSESKIPGHEHDQLWSHSLIRHLRHLDLHEEYVEPSQESQAASHPASQPPWSQETLTSRSSSQSARPRRTRSAAGSDVRSRLYQYEDGRVERETVRNTELAGIRAALEQLAELWRQYLEFLRQNSQSQSILFV